MNGWKIMLKYLNGSICIFIYILLNKILYIFNNNIQFKSEINLKDGIINCNGIVIGKCMKQFRF